METAQKPKLFYLFPDHNDIIIRELTDYEAAQFWGRGEHWVDLPQKGRKEAEELRTLLLDS